MSPIKFNTLFYFLMAVAALSAFVIPQQYTDKVEPQIQGLFYPVAGTARWAGSAVERRLGDAKPADPRTDASIRRENDRLLLENARLTFDLDELRKKDVEREKLGDVRRFCTPVKVVGSDAGNRESLAVSGSSLQGLKDGMCVLYGGDIVGTLQRSGLAGGQVQLVTNKDFRVTAFFGTFQDTPKGKQFIPFNNNNPMLVRGMGQGMMVCEMAHMAEVTQWGGGRGLRPGDWALLNDPDWPAQLQARRIGKVVSVGKRKDAPLFAEIRIRPETDLKRLREVMVLTKQ